MQTKKTILVVDDERDLLDLIEYNLNKEGYAVFKAENGLDGFELAKNHKPDLVLLDIMMPKMNGFETCKLIRKDEEIKNTPIIFLTAKSDEKTEVKSLNLGADDFLTKPISTTKLVTRIAAVLRRLDSSATDSSTSYKTNQNIIQVHDLVIDRERYLVLKNKLEFQLPKKEFELLFYLANRKGKVLDRQTLLNDVWGTTIFVIDRTIDVHVRKIREKLGDDYIETVKGVGYRFKD